MKHFMIKYRHTTGPAEAWHAEIARFIAALDGDAELAGKILYRCMKSGKDNRYYHLAATVDDQAAQTLQGRDYFKHYTAQCKLAAGGEVEVVPFETIAQTKTKWG